MIDERRHRPAIQVIEPAAYQRKSLAGKIVYTGKVVQLSIEPRLYRVLVSGGDVSQVVGHERPYVTGDDLLHKCFIVRRRWRNATGEPAAFADSGEVFDPIRASCAYPGLFQPVSYEGRLLVDGAMSMGVPAALARQLGATHVISVPLPPATPAATPNNMFQVVSRCFQILQGRFESSWRSESDLVIAPDVRGVDWNAFGRGAELVEAGEAAAQACLPKIREWFSPRAAAAREETLQVAMAY